MPQVLMKICSRRLLPSVLFSLSFAFSMIPGMCKEQLQESSDQCIPGTAHNSGTLGADLIYINFSLSYARFTKLKMLEYRSTYIKHNHRSCQQYYL